MSDPKDRIFIGQGFVVKPSLDKAMVVIERLLKNHPKMIALLEFTSPGRNHRQIDLALVGPGGIDLIEIKNKHGLVRGTVDGRWTVTNERGYTDNFSNFKRGVEENPYNQARNSADDFGRWIATQTAKKMWVSPVVWLPSASERSQIATEDFVRCAVGDKALPSCLRSSIRQSHEWGDFNYNQLPELLGLKPMTVSFLSGRVVDSHKHEAISGLSIMLQANDTQEAAETDNYGQFEFGVQKGMSFQLAVGVPEKYIQPTTINFVAERDYWQIPQIVLQEKLPKKTEDEIRAEERQVWQQRIEQLQRNMQQQTQTLEQQTQSLEQQQILMAQKMDEINHALARERLQLKAKEELLSQQARQLEEMQRLPLPVQAQHAAEIAELQAQTHEIEMVLTWMQVSTEPTQKMQALEQGIETLVNVAVSRRLALMDTASAPPASPVGEPLPSSGVQARQVEASVPTEPELIDAEFRLIDEPRVEVQHIKEPTWVAAAAPTASNPERVATQPIPEKSQSPKLWPWMMALGVLLALGAGWFWQSRQGTVPVVQEPQPTEQATPVTESAPIPATETASDLPGVPVDSAAPASPSDTLPGEPVQDGAAH